MRKLFLLATLLSVSLVSAQAYKGKDDNKFQVGLNLQENGTGRYFFTDGFGVYTEFNVPFAKYNADTLTTAETLNNQFSVNIGASFPHYLFLQVLDLY